MRRREFTALLAGTAMIWPNPGDRAGSNAGCSMRLQLKTSNAPRLVVVGR
jgi:hypothetical protein